MRPANSFFDYLPPDLSIQPELNRHRGDIATQLTELEVDSRQLYDFIVKQGFAAELGDHLNQMGDVDDKVYMTYLIGLLDEKDLLSSDFWSQFSESFLLSPEALNDCVIISEKLSTLKMVREKLRALFGYPSSLITDSYYFHSPNGFNLNNPFGYKMSGSSFHIMDDDHFNSQHHYTNADDEKTDFHAKGDKKQKKGENPGHGHQRNGGRRRKRNSGEGSQRGYTSYAPKDRLAKHYQTLGLDPNSLNGLSAEEAEKMIKKAYREGIFTNHSDRHDGSEAKGEIMKDLNAAREVLLTEAKKRPSNRKPSSYQHSSYQASTQPGAEAANESDYGRAEAAETEKQNIRTEANASSPNEDSANDDGSTAIALSR